MHGLLDSPAVFNALKRCLGNQRQPLLIPELPLRFGLTPISEAAELLGSHIEAAFGLEQPIDLLGFSIGGVIARAWIQLLGGQRRTRRFTSVGSPQQGTLTAQPWPGRLLAGIADLKSGSPLLTELNGNPLTLAGKECFGFYSTIERAVLPGIPAWVQVGHTLPVRWWAHTHTILRSQTCHRLAPET